MEEPALLRGLEFVLVHPPLESLMLFRMRLAGKLISQAGPQQH
jgi:hypothetical protein